MLETYPLVSVIIPSHNRRESLVRSLECLAKQSYRVSRLEVIVSADGCTDDTLSYLGNLNVPFTMQIVETPGIGAGGARNAGAELAHGSLLLFLDDDVMAQPGLVEAHVRAHQATSANVVIGYLLHKPAHRSGMFPYALRSWWEAVYWHMHKPNHRYDYTDLMSGNFSLAAALFEKVGGFDPLLRCREDYDLGYRLIQAGARFRFLIAAMGDHLDSTTLEKACQRKTDEGVADVAIGKKYPELNSTLMLSKISGIRRPLNLTFKYLSFTSPPVGDFLAGMIRLIINISDRLRLRVAWAYWLNILLLYYYWRGSAQALGNLGELKRWLNLEPVRQVGGLPIKIDLSDDIQVVEQKLAHDPLSDIVISRGSAEVICFPAKFACEPLNAAQLREMILSVGTMQLLRDMGEIAK